MEAGRDGSACAGAALLDDALAETIILPPGALVPRRLARRPFYVLRYASIVECGAADSSSVCLAFKTVDPTRADEHTARATAVSYNPIQWLYDLPRPTNALRHPPAIAA